MIMKCASVSSLVWRRPSWKHGSGSPWSAFSSAYVTGMEKHDRRSPAIDIVLGKAIHATIAAPFLLGGSIRGVLTAVRLTGDEAFDPSGIRMLENCSEVLAALMVRDLRAKILD